MFALYVYTVISMMQTGKYQVLMMLANKDSTVVEHLPRHPKAEGSSTVGRVRESGKNSYNV